MGEKTRNSNYDILDKILTEGGVKGQQSSGTWVVDEEHPEGHWVATKESLDQIRRSTDDIERYLRS